MREPALQARPHSAEPAVNATSARAKVLFEPKRSLIQPEAGIQIARLIRYPVITHSRVSVLAPKSRPSVGRATFTMVTSMRSMNSPATNAIATSHLYDTFRPPIPTLESSDLHCCNSFIRLLTVVTGSRFARLSLVLRRLCVHPNVRAREPVDPVNLVFAQPKVRCAHDSLNLFGISSADYCPGYL